MKKDFLSAKCVFAKLERKGLLECADVGGWEKDINIQKTSYNVGFYVANVRALVSIQIIIRQGVLILPVEAIQHLFSYVLPSSEEEEAIACAINEC